jgi:UbiD family decarboxylase
MLKVYPGDAGKVVTLGLMITKDPETKIPNIGVYRLQLQEQEHHDGAMVVVREQHGIAESGRSRGNLWKWQWRSELIRS